MPKPTSRGPAANPTALIVRDKTLADPKFEEKDKGWTWELAERYETPLPQLTSRVVELEAKVNGHLARMEFCR